MSEVDPSLLEALGNLMGIDAPIEVSDDSEERDDDFIQRLESAERLVNGLDG